MKKTISQLIALMRTGVEAFSPKHLNGREEDAAVFFFRGEEPVQKLPKRFKSRHMRQLEKQGLVRTVYDNTGMHWIWK